MHRDMYALRVIFCFLVKRIFSIFFCNEVLELAHKELVLVFVLSLIWVIYYFYLGKYMVLIVFLVNYYYLNRYSKK